MTLAGLTGQVLLAVAAGFIVGMGCARSPRARSSHRCRRCSPNSSGAVAGVVGGVGTVGGIVYPLVYAAPMMPSLHTGYSRRRGHDDPHPVAVRVGLPAARSPNGRPKTAFWPRAAERYLRGTDRRLSAEKPSLTGPREPDGLLARSLLSAGMTAVTLGPEGTYSHRATNAIADGDEIDFRQSVTAIVDARRRGRIRPRRHSHREQHRGLRDGEPRRHRGLRHRRRPRDRHADPPRPARAGPRSSTPSPATRRRWRSVAPTSSASTPTPRSRPSRAPLRASTSPATIPRSQVSATRPSAATNSRCWPRTFRTRTRTQRAWRSHPLRSARRAAARPRWWSTRTRTIPVCCSSCSSRSPIETST